MLASHQIAVGNTRPPIVPMANVPLWDCCVWGMIAMEAAVFRWQFTIPIGLGFLGAIGLYRKDYNAGRVFLCWLSTSAFDLAGRSVGGTFVVPRWTGGFRGIPEPLHGDR